MPKQQNQTPAAQMRPLIGFYTAVLQVAAIVLCLSTQVTTAQTTAPTIAERAQLDHAQQIMRRHGRFFTHKTWGPAWKPKTGKTWRPYTLGRWARTPGDTDWEWISSEPFGDTVYHYGRWTRDNDNGWIWIPGSRRAPAWVNWRQNAKHIGWAPTPPATPASTPSAQSDSARDSANSTAQDPANNWVFVPRNKMTNAGIKKYILSAAKTRNLFDTTVAIAETRAKTTRQARKARVPTNKAQAKPTEAKRNETFAQGDASGGERDYDNAGENPGYDANDENVATRDRAYEGNNTARDDNYETRNEVDETRENETVRQDAEDTDRSRRYAEEEPRQYDDDEYFVDDEDYDDDRSTSDRRAARRRFQNMEPAHRLPSDRWHKRRQRRDRAFADARRRMEETRGQIRARARVRARAIEMRRRFLLDHF